MSNDDIPTVNAGKIRELMQDYKTARSAAERREIETEVLAETVWQVDHDMYLLSEADLRTLLDRTEDDDKQVQRILRQAFLSEL